MSYDVRWADELEHYVLRLREALVRGDENLKALRLLESAPYLVADRPRILEALREQREMVLHAIDPAAYREYYGANPHEAPFEQMYGMTPTVAHDHLPRVGWLREQVAALELDCLLDLSANDGWMSLNFADVGVVVHGLDLNPGCIARARQRVQPLKARIRPKFAVGNMLEEKTMEWAAALKPKPEAVVFFETLEHLPDPQRALEQIMAEYVPRGGHLFVSTPHGAVERHNLPNWAHVERKGHLHSFTYPQFEEMLQAAGELVTLERGSDKTMFGAVRKP